MNEGFAVSFLRDFFALWPVIFLVAVWCFVVTAGVGLSMYITNNLNQSQKCLVEIDQIEYVATCKYPGEEQ